ncbi:hypothetical protein K0T92_18320 [Paenibacillus oenotherae]|uniref:DUF697 domain-containing protein n=1 Tax=Paenibacillus oenotherae TaxID=1435645 RepID=A0ABS7D9Q4_9BACL|nr:hypothetical protein [Paenibacillus oenotherae]MBW7476677.1 hypothetical protein [Paenibacillus oenotherae]
MIPKTIDELDKIREECKSMVNRRASVSAATAVVPLPGVDTAADIAIMLELVPAINRKFGLSPEQIEHLDSATKAKFFVIITSIGSELIGKVITKELIIKLLKKIGVRVSVKQVAKYIPLIGQALSAGVSFGAMKYLGNSHIDECYIVCKRMIET